jgi:hypothetical protein
MSFRFSRERPKDKIDYIVELKTGVNVLSLEVLGR